MVFETLQNADDAIIVTDEQLRRFVTDVLTLPPKIFRNATADTGSVTRDAAMT